MTAAEIATACGGAHRSGAWWRCHCPVHGSQGTTLALRDGDHGLIAVCHAGCARADIRAELRRRRLNSGGNDHHCRRRDHGAGDDRSATAGHVALARRIWECARDARGSPVMRYLAGRGITMSPPTSLRWAPSLRRSDGTLGPAMVARIDNSDGELIGVHRTWFERGPDGQWRRRERAMLGRAAGGAVRLASPEDSLVIAEGIETALSASQVTMQPVWAALSTAGMVALRLPPFVHTVVIIADNDRSGAGEQAARAAAARWCAEGRLVRLAMPREAGSDLNDVLIGRADVTVAELSDVVT